MAEGRKSKKRDAIYEALCSTKGHPTAEWIYQKLKPELPGLSLGTVYRNLNQFKENGRAICVGNVDGQDRFDGDTSRHAHFICTSCGRVDDIPDVEEPSMPKIDAKIDGYQLNYFGVCSDCKRKKAH